MLVTNRTMKLIFADNGQVITGDNIAAESMAIDKSICSGSNLKLGGCIASKMEITLIDIAPDSVSGRIFTAYFTDTTTIADTVIYPSDILYPSDALYPGQMLTQTTDRPVFTGQIDSAKRQKSNRKLTDITAYDALYYSGRRNVYTFFWQTATYSPTETISKFNDAIIDKMGLSVQSATWRVNTNQPLNLDAALVANKYASNISALELLRSVNELMCVFGFITPDGHYTVRELPYFTPVSVPEYENLEFEEYKTDKINMVALEFADNGLAKAGYTAGRGENCYYVKDNVLLKCTKADSTATVNTLAYNMAAAEGGQLTTDIYRYRPFTCKTEQAIDVAQKVTIPTSDNYVTSVDSIVTNVKITGILALKYEISASGDKSAQGMDTDNTTA